MAIIFNKIFNSKEEYNHIIEQYGEENGNILIKIWIARSLRIYVTERTMDFQSHLTNVLLNNLDQVVEEKYGTDTYILLHQFLATVDHDKLSKELNMNKMVNNTMKLIHDSAANHRNPIQQETYNWFLSNNEI